MKSAFKFLPRKRQKTGNKMLGKEVEEVREK